MTMASTATMNPTDNVDDDDCWNHTRLQTTVSPKEDEKSASCTPNSSTVTFQTNTDSQKMEDEADDPRAKYQSKKQLRFPSKDDVLNERHNISRLSTYELDELLAVWGDSEEKYNRKQAVKEDVKQFQKMGRRLSDNMTFTSVGLLDKVGERRVEKFINRERGLETVLSTQETQRRLMEMDCYDRIPGVTASFGRNGEDNDEVLAKLYKLTVQSAQEKAYNDALDLHNDIVNENNINAKIKKQNESSTNEVRKEMLKFLQHQQR